MSFVTLENFTVRYENTVPAADEDRVQAFLDDACAMVNDIVGEDDAYSDGDTVPGAIVSAVYTAVRRAYENPAGLTSETIGEYSYRVGTAAGAGVYFTLAEKKSIRQAAGRLGASSVELEGVLPAPATDEQYLGTTGGGDDVLYFDQSDLL